MFGRRSVAPWQDPSLQPDPSLPDEINAKRAEIRDHRTVQEIEQHVPLRRAQREMQHETYRERGEERARQLRHLNSRLGRMLTRNPDERMRELQAQEQFDSEAMVRLNHQERLDAYLEHKAAAIPRRSKFDASKHLDAVGEYKFLHGKLQTQYEQGEYDEKNDRWIRKAMNPKEAAKQAHYEANAVLDHHRIMERDDPEAAKKLKEKMREEMNEAKKTAAAAAAAAADDEAGKKQAHHKNSAGQNQQQQPQKQQGGPSSSASAPSSSGAKNTKLPARHQNHDPLGTGLAETANSKIAERKRMNPPPGYWKVYDNPQSEIERVAAETHAHRNAQPQIADAFRYVEHSHPAVYDRMEGQAGRQKRFQLAHEYEDNLNKLNGGPPRAYDDPGVAGKDYYTKPKGLREKYLKTPRVVRNAIREGKIKDQGVYMSPPEDTDEADGGKNQGHNGEYLDPRDPMKIPAITHDHGMGVTHEEMKRDRELQQRRAVQDNEYRRTGNVPVMAPPSWDNGERERAGLAGLVGKGKGKGIGGDTKERLQRAQEDAERRQREKDRQDQGASAGHGPHNSHSSTSTQPSITSRNQNAMPQKFNDSAIAINGHHNTRTTTPSLGSSAAPPPPPPPPTTTTTTAAPPKRQHERNVREEKNTPHPEKLMGEARPPTPPKHGQDGRHVARPTPSLPPPPARPPPSIPAQKKQHGPTKGPATPAAAPKRSPMRLKPKNKNIPPVPPIPAVHLAPKRRAVAGNQN